MKLAARMAAGLVWLPFFIYPRRIAITRRFPIVAALRIAAWLFLRFGFSVGSPLRKTTYSLEGRGAWSSRWLPNVPALSKRTANLIPTTEELPTSTLAELARRIRKLEDYVEQGPKTDQMCMVVFSGELDRLLAAFVIATGAAACGTKVSMFFTFWATPALQRRERQALGKSFVERCLDWLLPRGLANLKLSRMNFCGLGRWMISREMSKKNISSLPQLVNAAAELGVSIAICEMSMSLMGIRAEEIIAYPKLEYCGVARFLDRAAACHTTLFI